MGTQPRFSAIITKGENFYDFLFVPLAYKALLEEHILSFKRRLIFGKKKITEAVPLCKDSRNH